MNWFQRVLRRERLEQELDDELRFHVDRLVDDYVASGLSEREARRRAAREFGTVELVKEDCRRARGTEWLVDILADARVGLRLFSKEPGFSAVAVATLALGLGVNTVFFSIVNTFCLTGLPFPSASHLVDVSVIDESGHRHSLSTAQAQAIGEIPSIERIGFYTTRPVAVRTKESIATRRTVAFVSDDALALIGEAPSQGRALRPDEQRDPQARIALLSADVAKELFGTETAAVGRDAIIDGVTTAVVGVMPRAASFPDSAAVWQPLSSLRLPASAPELSAFARLKGDAASAADVRADIETRLRQNALLPSDRQHALVIPLNDRYRGRVTDPVWIAFITAGALVVLIACSNVGNLLLARGVRRATEIATRLSLGASRSRILRQLLTETFVLVAVACGGAALVSWAALRALRAAIPPAALPSWAHLDLDVRVVAALLAVGAITIVLSGLAPAVQIVRGTGMLPNARTISHNRSISRWTSAFLSVQIALSVVLLCAVGITVQVYLRLTTAGIRAQVAQVLTADVSLALQRYPTAQKREKFFADLRRGLTDSAQVTNVSFARALPGARGEPRWVAAGSVATGAMAATVVCDSGYFSTLGLPLLSGHALADDDDDTPGSGVIVNERFARLFFGEVGVVGRQIRFASREDAHNFADSRTIVGVVPSIGGQAALNPPPIVYVARRPGAESSSIVLLRGSVPPQDLAPVLRDAVSRLDPDVALADVLPLMEANWEARWNGRVSQALITAIASVGLCLAMVGVAAVTAHRIATRARELGIRVALGATPAQLARGVLGPVMMQLLIGLVAGALLAKAWQRAFASPIATSDNLVLVSALVTVATLAFSGWPARRVAHADPIEVLRIGT